MEISSIGALATSFTIARDMAKAMVGLRDFNEISPKLANLNDALLKAQDGLFDVRAESLALQEKYFEATQELRKLREALDERGRYSLFEIAPGHFAYRVNLPPEQGGTGEPTDSEPLHYLCQPCFDGEKKAVLGFTRALPHVNARYTCPICERKILVLDSALPGTTALVARSFPMGDWNSRG